jgi:Tfp pilus assembly protein FimV
LEAVVFRLIFLLSLFVANNSSAQPLLTEDDLYKLRNFAGVAAPSDSMTSLDLSGNVLRVKSGDTLGQIVETYYAGSGVNKDFLAQVIVSKNPTAFRRGNPNWMMAGAALRLPEGSDLVDYIMPEESEKPSTEMRDWVSYP